MLVSKMKKVGVKGFSLVELMVVVAIIGILAAVAIPNFQRFQRKARQSEARSLLGGIFTAQQSFRAEWEEYTTDLVLAGFQPSGQLGYHAGFGPGVEEQSDNYDDAEARGAVAFAQDDSRNSTREAAVCAAPNCDTMALRVCDEPAGSLDNPGGGADPEFTATACGNLGGANEDQWSIDQARLLANTQDGVQ